MQRHLWLLASIAGLAIIGIGLGDIGRVTGLALVEIALGVSGSATGVAALAGTARRAPHEPR